MMKNVQDRYLLGEADENERAELEQEYFADDEAFDRLVEAENDLVDAYVQGTLTAGERKRFEERFLTTDAGVETVAFARALRERIAARAKPVPLGRWYPAPRRLAIAASLALFGFATAWVLFSLRQAQAPPPIQRQITRQSPAPPPAPSISETALLTVLLTPGGTRDDQAAPPLVLRPAPQWVQLELVLEENRYDSYTAELQDVEGRVLWKQEGLQAARNRVTPRVPAKLLPPGDYVVILQGARRGSTVEINNYTFTVMALPGRR